MQFSSSVQDKMLQRQVENIFATYDLDNNGILDMNELRIFVKQVMSEVFDTEAVSDEKF